MNLWTLLLFLLSAVSAENTKCSKPVLDGNVVLTDEALMINDFPNGTTITLECALGHLVDHGSNSIICTDGQWSKQELTCKKKDCGYPRLSPHMNYEIKDGTLFGASIRPVCEKGYYLVGSSYRKCLANGWSGQSNCFVVTCKEPTVIPHAIIAVPLTKEHPEYKDVIEYACEENYTLIGNSSISCQEDGEYSSPPPSCIVLFSTSATPTDIQERESSSSSPRTLAIAIGMIGAVILECSKPVLEGNVVLTDEALMINDFPNGTTITLECALGHLVDHGSNSIICTDGQWSKQELTCKKKDCGYPRLSPHMHYEVKDGTLFGASIRPVCEKGYYLVGSSYRKCLANGWSGQSNCFVVTCKEPTVNPHAIIAVPLTKEHPEYKDVIKYACEENYTLIGNSSISCQEDGEYSSPPPSCIVLFSTNATPTDFQERESSSSSPRTLAIVIGMISAVILVLCVIFAVRLINKRNGSLNRTAPESLSASDPGEAV